MPVCYYDVYYADGGYEQVYRYEDMLACKQGGRKLKSIKFYRLTDSGWKVEVIV